jgi:RNA polymerase sigma-70 factor (ECF subfamily)
MIDWNALVRNEGPAVWRTIQRLVHNRADADECLQETFIAALRFSERNEVDCLPALLKRLAVARAIDCLRRRSRRTRHERPLDPANELAGEKSPIHEAESAELAAELRWAIGQLPARSAEAFCLHELEDWSYAEIGRHLGLSVSAVGVLVHRARQKLRKLLNTANERFA